MALVAFPPALPHVSACRFTYAKRTAVPNIEGPKRARARLLDRIKAYEVEWEFTLAEYEVFKTWWMEEADQGGAFCSIKTPGRGGIVARRSQFIGPYRTSMNGPLAKKISAQLEVTEPY